MIFPDSQVAEVCRLGPFKAAALLERARGGDLHALTGVLVRGVYRQLLKLGASPVAALHHSRVFFSTAELRPRITL